jgi:hypothetical protein
MNGSNAADIFGAKSGGGGLFAGVEPDYVESEEGGERDEETKRKDRDMFNMAMGLMSPEKKVHGKEGKTEGKSKSGNKSGLTFKKPGAGGDGKGGTSLMSRKPKAGQSTKHKPISVDSEEDSEDEEKEGGEDGINLFAF